MPAPKLLILLAFPLLCLATACAPQKTTALTPTEEELPRLQRLERIIPAKVGIEELRDDRRLVLVPDYKEPPLTPEERAALGEEQELFNWLEFYVPRPDVTRVWPAFGGASVAIDGMAGWGFGVTPWRPPYSMSSELGGNVTGVHFERDTRFGQATRADRPIWAHGPTSGVRVGEGRPCNVSAHQTRPEP